MNTELDLFALNFPGVSQLLDEARSLMDELAPEDREDVGYSATYTAYQATVLWVRAFYDQVGLEKHPYIPLPSVGRDGSGGIDILWETSQDALLLNVKSDGSTEYVRTYKGQTMAKGYLRHTDDLLMPLTFFLLHAHQTQPLP